jgi:hypothetical protein
MSVRPKLVTFKVEAFSSENREEGGATSWEINVSNTIEIGVAVPTVPGAAIAAIVKVRLVAAAHNLEDAGITASFKGDYVGQFKYPTSATEQDVTAFVSDEDHRYLLAAQVFPLAMSHFRRELLSTGFDAKNLPFGL